MINVGMMQFKNITDGRGDLTPIEATKDIPFEIKRIYYITGVQPKIRRGLHAHMYLHQVLLCLNGSVRVHTKTPLEGETFLLNNPLKGLYIGPMVWREMFDFSAGAVLLVLASEYYDERDYFRDYTDYEGVAKKFFGCEALL